MTITVKLRPNDSPEKAVSKLKNLVIKEGLYKEIKDRRYYEKAKSQEENQEREAGERESQGLS